MDSRQVLSSLTASHASIRAAGVCAASHVPQTEEAFPLGHPSEEKSEKLGFVIGETGCQHDLLRSQCT